MKIIIPTPCRAQVFVLVLGALTLCGSPVWAQVIFEDGFESADLGHSQSGFKWGGPNRTSIVRDDQYRVWANRESMMDGPYEDREWENAPGSVGRHALRFYYPAGTAMSEQRFSLGGAYPELWMSYWIRVPINYTHGTIGPGPGYRNQKFSAVWTDAYSGSGQPVVVFNLWDDRNAWNAEGNIGSSYSTVSISNATNMSSAHKEQFRDFIRFPEDRGRWMHVVSQFKIASSRGAEDGVVRWWRRWSNETEYTLISDRSNLGIGTDTGPAGFTGGYLMGWANGKYEEDTEFLVDDFKVSKSSLLNPGGPAPKTPELVKVE